MDHQRVALDKLNPQHWMTVFYWTDSGKMPPRPQAPGQPPHPGLAPDPNDDADMDDHMNDAPDEDDADLPALEPIQPTPPAPPMPPGPTPTVPHTGPQTFDISTPPASDYEMESPNTPPPHPPTPPSASPDPPVTPSLPTAPQKRHESHTPEASIHTPSQPQTKPKAINPMLPFIPKFVSKPAPAMPASSSSQPPSNHLGGDVFAQFAGFFDFFIVATSITTAYRYNGFANTHRRSRQ